MIHHFHAGEIAMAERLNARGDDQGEITRTDPRLSPTQRTAPAAMQVGNSRASTLQDARLPMCGQIPIKQAKGIISQYLCKSQ
jgi:hypothetical protein